MAFEVPLLGLDELESQSLKLCADIDAFGQGGLDILCPLSPDVHDELFTPFSGALSGDSTDESLLSSPSLGASLAQDASSCLDALHSHQSQQLPLAASQRQESVVSAYHPAATAQQHQQHYQLVNTSSCSDDGDQSTCPSSSQLTDDAGSTRSQKRAKLEWTAELHARFVEAVESLPCDKQVPSRILERMGAAGRGLTRANIASHLQKYRSNSGRRKSSDSDLTAMAAASATTFACAGGVVVGVPCFPLMQAPAGGFPAAPTAASGSPAVLPMLWPATPHAEPLLSAPSAPAAPSPSAATMIPTPHGAAAAATGGALSPLDVDLLALDLGMPQLPVPAELTRELEEVLAGKRKRAPLGLRLDCAALAQELNFGRFNGAGM